MQNRQEQLYNELLVTKCQKGDSKAFRELVSKWQERLWRYAFKITGSDATAWDLVQETWCGVIKGLGRLEDVSNFPCWVFRLLHNKCVDWIRKEQVSSKLNMDIEENILRKAGPENNDHKDVLQAAIEKLTTDRRALIMLRYKEDLAIGQIAKVLNIPEGTVKSRLHRTVNELRKLVERD